LRFSRKLTLAAGALCCLALHAELSQWVQNLAVESGLQAVFFRTVSLPAGDVEARRPPAETRPALTELIAAKPTDAQLYRLRASEAELALDFTAAEADWRKYAELAHDYLALADFYHRRLRPLDEIRALDSVASQNAFERSIAVVREQGLPVPLAMAQYRTWIVRYPHESAVYKQFFNYLVEQKQFTAASRRIEIYRQAFPRDLVEPVREEAYLAEHQGTTAQALAVYDRAFTPRMPAELIKDYFDLLKTQGKLRDFLAAARQQVEADPQDLKAAARIFYYYQQQANVPAARRALVEYANRHKNWTADEHDTIACLFEDVEEYDEAARHFYALYTLPGADANDRERGLGGLARLLLAAPEQPIHFGAGNLSYYRDIATIDPYPGFLNGILSLLLNSAQPRVEYAQQEQAALTYFHRAQASDLLRLFDTEFPKSPRRAILHALLIEAYASYGDNEGVLRAGRQFLAVFPKAPERTTVALLMADAYARQEKPEQELAVYDQVLKELGARSPQYAAILDRYISRLVSQHSIAAALEVLRHEIDRNPKDQTLYERLAAFLDQNRRGAEVEQVYQRAIQKFPGASWEDKLARWYLRYRRTAQFAQLTQQVAKIFSGTDLERYFREVVAPASVDAHLYLQLNLYAHDRFPDNLTFVKNLLDAYTRKGTTDFAAYTRLLRAYWFYDDGLRARFFEALSRAGKLNAELAALRATKPDASANPAAADFLAEGEAWQSHFESAAPWLRALSESIPGNMPVAARASAVYRSLAAFDPKDTDVAAALAVNMHRYEPRNRDLLARIGDIYADRDLFTRAAPYWNRMPQTAPGDPAGYLEAATVFWDYYRYNDALRLLNQARTKAANPNLYAYEEGAIYESKRDYPAAVREYIKGALATPDSASEKRLAALAERPALRNLVGQLTVDAVSAPNPGMAALTMRVDVLGAENRSADLEAFLSAVARRADLPETLAWIETVATSHSFDSVRELALERQIEVCHDPVEKVRLRLALVAFYEGKHDTAAARRVIEAVYADNPATLGVVRARVDFYWRNQMPTQAIVTLTRAAGAANADYRKQFTLEAARKATESGEYAQARALLAPLMAADPYNGEYLAASAQTWARAGDDQGLRDFYAATIQTLRQAPLAPDERTSRIAAMRRGLIPALTRLKQYTAAVDQYIEIINRYPEDEGLVREAASYAIEHSLQPRLLTYYSKTAAESSRDYRWPVVLARLETHFEDFPAAIAAYSRAVVIRPDRSDLFAARATLEVRLMRFEEVAATYARLYELSYRDPQWLIKVAETYARLQKADLAVETLRKALLAGRPERPDILFQMARTLDSWGLVPQALPFAERGLTLAGTGKWVKEDHTDGAALYASLMTRLRRYDEAFARIDAIKPAAEDAGSAAIRASQMTRLRRDAGLTGVAAMMPAFEAAGSAARVNFSPDEMSAFAAFLEKRGPIMLPVAERAGLVDLEAHALSADVTKYQRLIDLETRCMRFVELARFLEDYVKTHPSSDARDRLIGATAEAWHASGDVQNERRFLADYGGNFSRYLELLAKFDPARLVTLAKLQRSAVEQAIATGPASLAYQAVAAHGQSHPPVWTKAYTALVGLYDLDRDARVDAAFRGALDSATIGQRLAKPADRDRELAGDVWFYYGSRYGEYLAGTHQGDPEDYLPASLEAAPGNPEAYVALADFYADAGEAARALADYDRALELNAGLGYVHDHAALVLWKAGRRDDAIARWKSALAAFERQQGRPNLAEDFWAHAPEALRHIGERDLFNSLRPEVESLLRSYIRRHDWYRLDSLLEPVGQLGGLDLIVDAAAAAPDADFLGRLAGLPWLSARDRERILRRVIAALPEARARGYQVQLIALLVETKQTAAARALLESIPRDARIEIAAQIAPLELQIATQSGKLPELLASYRRSPEIEPSVEALREAATALRGAGDEASARRILEFLYTRELERGNFDAANFLGLAEIRLENGDVPSAMALLHRTTLISGEPFENFMSAATLLERFGHTAEAIEFLAARVRAVPWDQDARLKLAEAQHSVPALTALVTDTLAAYTERAAAARLLGKWGVPVPPAITGELALLARGKVSPAAAGQPLYFEARVTAAETAADPLGRARLLRAALALQPDSVPTRVAVLHAELAAGHDQLAVSAAASLDRTAIPQEDLLNLATAYENLGELEEARQSLQQMPANADIEKRIERLSHRIDIAAQNALRRPVIRDNVVQDHLVRPRIIP
jgi:Flp pilus assembly protein TadD